MQIRLPTQPQAAHLQLDAIEVRKALKHLWCVHLEALVLYHLGLGSLNLWMETASADIWCDLDFFFFFKYT